MKYQSYLPLRSMATEMTLNVIKLISSIFRWIDDTYESLMAGGYIKEDIWLITTWVIRSIFEYYLSLARSTAAKASFDSDSQHHSTLSWGVIKVHLAADKMLEKSIKDHPIVVGDYAQWIVSNYGIKEITDSNSMTTKLKDKVDELSSSYDSSSKSIN